MLPPYNETTDSDDRIYLTEHTSSLHRLYRNISWQSQRCTDLVSGDNWSIVEHCGSLLDTCHLITFPPFGKIFYNYVNVYGQLILHNLSEITVVLRLSLVTTVSFRYKVQE